ncbi:transposase [Legionella pneumophila]
MINGITEDFHRKMKLIQRRAYGFRNFENYRTRVKAAVLLIGEFPRNWERPKLRHVKFKAYLNFAKT